MEKLFKISEEEWNKIKWNEIDRTCDYTPDYLWENGYKIVGEFKIEAGLEYMQPEYLYQNDGQLYVARRGILGKVYMDGEWLFSGEKIANEMPDIWEEEMLKRLNVDCKIRVRKNAIVFCNRDARLQNFLKKNGVRPIPEFNMRGYEACYTSDLDIFKKAVEKYPKYYFVYQPDKITKGVLCDG